MEAQLQSGCFAEGQMMNLPQLRDSRRASVEAFPSRSDRDGVSPRDEPTGRVLTHRQIRILSIGDDSILLYSRRLILEAAGYSVESARGDVSTIEQILLRGVDLILLCHSIGEDVVSRIVEASTRIAPQTPLLQISPLDNPFGNKTRPTLVSADPAGLLSAVAGQLATQREPYGNRLRATG
jgi:hypothetical protein